MILEDRLVDIVRASSRLMAVLHGVRDLDLPDWRLVSGSVYQTVWNALTGRVPDYGLKDYDAVYFDPDTSYEAEDVHIRRAAAAFAPPLDAMVEVRNQARVHLWFERKFGEAYAPLLNTDEALERFVCPAFAVGIRLEPEGVINVAAPFGLDDLFAMRLRPNPNRPINMSGFDRVVASVGGRWPEISVVLEEASRCASGLWTPLRRGRSKAIRPPWSNLSPHGLRTLGCRHWRGRTIKPRRPSC